MKLSFFSLMQIACILFVFTQCVQRISAEQVHNPQELQDSLAQWHAEIMQEEGDFLHHFSSEFVTCYEKYCNGHTLNEDEIVAMVAELNSILKTLVLRAERPDAPSVNNPNAIVGNTCCDLGTLTNLISQVRMRIGTITDNDCCNSVIGVLGNACTILGPEATISGTLQSLIVELSMTITTLIDIEATLTTCCAAIQQDFADTWTILAGIKTTVTACCAQVQQDFASTFTQLAELQSSITSCCAALALDFADTWTILAELQTSLTTCCENVQEVFGCDVLIYQSQLPYTISSPGVYCLAESITYGGITNPITIAGSAQDVVLKFQGHTLTRLTYANGISIEAGAQNINIQNGTYVCESGVADLAINCAGASIVQVQDFVVINPYTNGISINTASDQVILKNVQILGGGNGSGGIGVLQILNSTDCQLTNVSVVNSNSDGIQIANSNNIILEHVNVSNSTLGLGLNISNVNYMDCYDVVLDNNVVGCQASTVTGLTLRSVTIQNSKSASLSVTNGTFVICTNLVAQDASIGFFNGQQLVIDQSSIQGLSAITFNDSTYIHVNRTAMSTTSGILGLVFSGAQYVVVDRCTLQGFYLAFDSASSNCVVQDCVVQNVQIIPGIQIAGTNFVIKNCKVVGCALDGIHFANPASSAIVTNNECLNNGGVGIYVDTAVTKMQIIGNNLLSNNTYGIQINNFATSPQIYIFNNLANQNGSANYFNVPSQITSDGIGAAAGFWANVD